MSMHVMHDTHTQSVVGGVQPSICTTYFHNMGGGASTTHSRRSIFSLLSISSRAEHGLPDQYWQAHHTSLTRFKAVYTMLYLMASNGDGTPSMAILFCLQVWALSLPEQYAISTYKHDWLLQDQRQPHEVGIGSFDHKAGPRKEALLPNGHSLRTSPSRSPT